MSATPALAVVTLTFNAARDLPRLLASLRAQSDRDFQFIVLDGASTDGTVELLAAASDIVTTFRSEPDQGFFDALNKALRLIEANYYVVVGADDQLDRDAIKNYRRVAAATGADMVVADVLAGNKTLRGFHPRRAWLGPPYMFTSHSVGTLFRTTLHARCGAYSLQYPVYADSLFMKRAALTPGIKVVTGDFIAGEFNMEGGFSKSNFVRSICELWMVQRETGENALVQLLLFQLRILWNLRRTAF